MSKFASLNFLDYLLVLIFFHPLIYLVNTIHPLSSDRTSTFLLFCKILLTPSSQVFYLYFVTISIISNGLHSLVLTYVSVFFNYVKYLEYGIIVRISILAERC